MYANPAAEASAGKDALHSGWVSKQTTTLTDKGKRTRRSSVTQLVQGYEPLFAVLRPKTIAFYKEPVDYETGQDPKQLLMLSGGGVQVQLHGMVVEDGVLKARFDLLVKKAKKKTTEVHMLLVETRDDMTEWLNKLTAVATVRGENVTKFLGELDTFFTINRRDMQLQAFVTLSGSSLPTELVRQHYFVMEPHLIAFYASQSDAVCRTNPRGGFPFPSIQTFAADKGDSNSIVLELAQGVSCKLTFDDEDAAEEWLAAGVSKMPTKEGRCNKQSGGKLGLFQQRQVVLQRGLVCYYKDESHQDLRGIVEPHLIERVVRTKNFFELHTPGRTYQFWCDNDEQCAEWAGSVNGAIQELVDVVEEDDDVDDEAAMDEVSVDTDAGDSGCVKITGHLAVAEIFDASQNECLFNGKGFLKPWAKGGSAAETEYHVVLTNNVMFLYAGAPAIIDLNAVDLSMGGGLVGAVTGPAVAAAKLTAKGVSALPGLHSSGSDLRVSENAASPALFVMIPTIVKVGAVDATNFSVRVHMTRRAVVLRFESLRQCQSFHEKISPLMPTLSAKTEKLKIGMFEKKHKRFMVLQGGVVFYFADEERGALKGAIKLRDIKEIGESNKYFMMQLPGRAYQFFLPSYNIVDEWCRALASQDTIKQIVDSDQLSELQNELFREWMANIVANTSGEIVAEAPATVMMSGKMIARHKGEYFVTLRRNVLLVYDSKEKADKHKTTFDRFHMQSSSIHDGFLTLLLNSAMISAENPNVVEVDGKDMFLSLEFASSGGQSASAVAEAWAAHVQSTLCVRRGYLNKRRAGLVQKLQQRYCLLQPHALLYFDNEELHELRGEVYIPGAMVQHGKSTIMISAKTHAEGDGVVAGGQRARNYEFVAEDTAEAVSWEADLTTQPGVKGMGAAQIAARVR